MPAIDPRRLRRDAAEAAQAAGDPDEALRRALDLLEYHADRTRRPTATARAEDVLPGFGTPGPVRRALTQAFDDALASDQEARWALIETLWRSGYREAQEIAADLMGALSGPTVPERVEGLVLERSTNRIARRWLVDRGLHGWREREPAAFVGRVETWLESAEQALVASGLEALMAGLDSLPSEHLPACFAALSGLADELNGSEYRMYRSLLEKLSRRNPPECAQFLLDELRRHNHAPAYRDLVRRLVDGFVGAQRAELEGAMTRGRE